MSYGCWQDFVLQWQAGNKIINGWSNPDSIPLYNDPGHTHLSSQFIPEPWWGNDRTYPLHSIIINYNPGQGRDHQRFGAIPPIHSYANNIVNSGVFPKTVQWHCDCRAFPILDSLHRLGVIGGPYGLHNHLSLELIPWHTYGVNKDYWKYVKQNIRMVYEKVIRFAAERSRDIENEKLNSVVILRISGVIINRIIKWLNNAGLVSTVINPPALVGNAKYMEFSIATLPSVRFIGIWGACIRNKMPSRADLDAIISII